jgi:hypothetical protein
MTIVTVCSLIISLFIRCLLTQLPWDNYRLSHSDGKPYGDLDPRFLDDINRNENPYKDLDVTLGTLRTYTAITEREDLQPLHLICRMFLRNNEVYQYTDV